MQCGGQVGEDLPLENRPQEPLVDDYDHEHEERECDVVDTTRPCTDESIVETRNMETVSEKKEYLVSRDVLNNRQVTDADRSKLKISTSNKIPSQDANPSKPKRPLSSTGDVSTSESSISMNDNGHRRSQSAGKESELKNHALLDKNPRRKNDELSKFPKKKSNPVNSEKVDSVKTQKIEVKTKTTSEVTQSETVNCVKPDTKHHGKAEKPVSKKEQAEKTNSTTVSPRKSSHSKQSTVGGNPAHSGSKSTSPRDASHAGATTKTSSDTTQSSVKRSKDGTNATDNTYNVSTANDSSRASTKGASTSSHSPSNSKTASGEGEREHKPSMWQFTDFLLSKHMIRTKQTTQLN